MHHTDSTRLRGQGKKLVAARRQVAGVADDAPRIGVARLGRRDSQCDGMSGSISGFCRVRLAPADRLHLYDFRRRLLRSFRELVSPAHRGRRGEIRGDTGRGFEYARRRPVGTGQMAAQTRSLHCSERSGRRREHRRHLPAQLDWRPVRDRHNLSDAVFLPPPHSGLRRDPLPSRQPGKLEARS